jgi:hypothetical protein
VNTSACRHRNFGIARRRKVGTLADLTAAPSLHLLQPRLNAKPVTSCFTRGYLALHAGSAPDPDSIGLLELQQPLLLGPRQAIDEGVLRRHPRQQSSPALLSAPASAAGSPVPSTRPSSTCGWLPPHQLSRLLRGSACSAEARGSDQVEGAFPGASVRRSDGSTAGGKWTARRALRSLRRALARACVLRGVPTRRAARRGAPSNQPGARVHLRTKVTADPVQLEDRASGDLDLSCASTCSL